MNGIQMDNLLTNSQWILVILENYINHLVTLTVDFVFADLC